MLVKHIWKSLFTAQYQLFCRHLRDARRKAGFNQTELAERLDLQQMHISRSETGERKVDIIELRAFCRVMGLDFVRFVTVLDEDLTRLEADPTRNPTPEYEVTPVPLDAPPSAKPRSKRHSLKRRADAPEVQRQAGKQTTLSKAAAKKAG